MEERKTTVSFMQAAMHLAKYDVMYLGDMQPDAVQEIITTLSDKYGITAVVDKYRLRKYPMEYALLLVGSDYYKDRMEAYGVAC